MMSDMKLVEVTTASGVATILLNRPGKYNAFSRGMLEQLGAALSDLDAAEDVRCIVLAGTGKAFAAGADISEYYQVSSEQLESFTRLANRVREAIRAHRLPVIAAVNGLALGGGFEMALSCDMIVCAETAKLGLPELSLGLIPGWGGTQALTQQVGRRRAFEVIVLGQPLSASEARALGLVQAIVPPEELLAKSTELAAAVAAAPAEAVAAARKAINRASAIHEEAFDFEQDLLRGLFPTADGLEGVRAFVEKRPAIFNQTPVTAN